MLHSLISFIVHNVLDGRFQTQRVTSAASAPITSLVHHHVVQEQVALLEKNGPSLLGSTLQQRRRLIQALRLLRLELTAFEQRYISTVGHLPTTNTDRGEMQPVYSTYTSWKKRIREYAAVTIQGTFRKSRKPVGKITKSCVKITSLKQVKRELKTRLQNFDDDFFLQHQRKVSFYILNF